MDILLKNLSNIIASIALIFAAISVFISYKSLREQRKHNIKSIRPILHVGQWDYENDLCVTVKNCGLGIALVNRLSVMNKETNEVRDHIYAWLPAKLEANVNYKKYWTPNTGFVVQTSEIIDLIKIPIDDSKPEQVRVREHIRAILCTLIVQLEYEDVYENEMPIKTMELSHFARKDNVNKTLISL